MDGKIRFHAHPPLFCMENHVWNTQGRMKNESTAQGYAGRARDALSVVADRVRAPGRVRSRQPLPESGGTKNKTVRISSSTLYG
jgi:hypothetical protein